MTDRQWTRKLDQMLDEIFAESDRQDWTLVKMAAETGLHINTVSRINDRITRQPRLSTVVKLAAALGMDMVLRRAAAMRKVG